MATTGFDQLKEMYPGEIGELMLKTRKLILDEFPDVFEVAWIKQKTIGYGIGPKKMSEHFCWMGVYSQHIVLGFNYGTELSDPENILEGTGKLFRHYKIKTVEDIARPALKQMVKEAIADIQQRNQSK